LNSSARGFVCGHPALITSVKLPCSSNGTSSSKTDAQPTPEGADAPAVADQHRTSVRRPALLVVPGFLVGGHLALALLPGRHLS
jgi:hypothetical protein